MHAAPISAVAARHHFVAALLIISWLGGAHAQPAFTVDDVEVCSAAYGVVDPEFYSAGRVVAFYDRQNHVKVATLRSDATLGAAGCKGTIVDSGVTLSVPGFPLVNGAEWALSQRGVEFYYTRLDGAGATEMVRAYQNGGSWVAEPLDASTGRGLPIPSMNADDAQARILYAHGLVGGGYELMWRESTDPTTEQVFPTAVRRATGGAPRWVRGMRAITTVLPDARGIPQAARIDIDSGTSTLLTSDEGRKDEVWMWAAPEFGGAWVFITVVDQSQLRVYRQEGSAWVPIRSLDAPAFAGRPHIYSPEPYIVNGRSYVAMQLSDQKVGSSDIWIAAIDPAQPLERQVSDPATPWKVRSEPEWAVTTQGAFVFYTQSEGGGKASLRRVRTGL